MSTDYPFTETKTSYYHHSVGGFHAAKLRGYQDLIDHCLMPGVHALRKALQPDADTEEWVRLVESMPALHMLNTRYIIYDPQHPPLHNPYACGNAWFVHTVRMAANADEEMAALQTLKPGEEAVVDQQFADGLQGFVPIADPTATIKLVAYRPNRLEYESAAQSEQFAIFSEIYYQPGWRASIDGVPAPHIRANWTLRAMRIPAGNHRITFEFYPENYVIAANVEAYSSFLVLLVVMGATGWLAG